MIGKPVRLFTCVWGSYLDTFESALVRSLNWPLNKQALQGAIWDLCTEEKHFGDAADIAKKLGIKIELHAIPDKATFSDMGVLLCEVFKPCIRRCIETDSRMLLAPPDTIFGGDTVANLLNIGRQRDTVVFVAHPRVHPTIVGELSDSVSIGNDGLVSLAWKHLHKSWSEAEYYPEVQRTNSQVGGVMWKKLNDDTIFVTHRLPTPYLINWNEDDYAFFNREVPPGVWPPVFGEIDHTWPATLVLPQERARYIGSSSAAFIVEITDAEKNIPPLSMQSNVEPDKFWRNAFHNQVFRQMSVIFNKE